MLMPVGTWMPSGARTCVALTSSAHEFDTRVMTAALSMIHSWLPLSNRSRPQTSEPAVCGQLTGAQLTEQFATS